MQEIRFSHSLEQAEKYFRELEANPYTQYRDRCDYCGHFRRGVFQLVEGTFICTVCMAKDKFLELVGLPDD